MVDIFERARIAEILNITDDDKWKINDRTSDGLVLLAADEKHILGSTIHGLIFDIKSETVVCPPLNKMNFDCVTDKVPIIGNDVKVTVDGLNISLPLNECKIYAGYDGAVYRVFHHNGKTRYATQKKIDGTFSRWGPSDTFSEIYEQLGGCDPYVEGVPKDVVFFFLMVHPSLQVVSHLNVAQGALVLIRVHSSDNTYVPTRSDRFRWVENNEISLDVANLLLKGKNHPDPRLSSGDTVIICHQIATIRLVSPSYAWRSDCRNDDNNHMNMLYTRLGDGNVSGLHKVSDDDFLKKYVPLKYIPINALKDQVEKCVDIDFQLGDAKYSVMEKNRRYCIFMNVLHMVPPTSRMSVIEAFENYGRDRRDFIDWVCSDDFSLVNVKNDKRLVRMKTGLNRLGNIVTIIEKAMGQKDYNMRSHVHNLVKNERGESLFRLIKIMKVHTSPNKPVSTQPSVEGLLGSAAVDEHL